jgi:hypothetical protein
MQLDQKQKKMLRLAKVADKGDIALLEEINSLDESVIAVDAKVDEIASELALKVDKALSIAEETKKTEVKGLPGDDGYTPIKGKDYFDGKDGDNYILTDSDKTEIASKIEVPVVEKVVERSTIIKEIPIITEKVVQVAVTDLPDMIIEKVNTSSKQIKRERVEGLDALEARIVAVGERGKGGGGPTSKLIAGANISLEQVGGDTRISVIPVADTDEKTKVSANDTTAGYLNGKLVAGSGITFTENNNGGNETLTVAFDNAGGYITGATDSTLTETGDTLGINLANSNTWTGVQHFNLADETVTPTPPTSANITFTLDGSGFFANGTTYQYYIYSYYYDGFSTAYDSGGLYVSATDPNDSSNYNIDLDWSGATQVTGYIIYDANGNQYIDVGNVVAYQITPFTSWTGGTPTLSPTSIVVPRSAAWFQSASDYFASDFTPFKFGYNGLYDYLRFKWDFAQQHLRFENAYGTIQEINTNIHADTVYAGTLTTGSPIGIAYGGTGASSFGANRIPYMNSGNTAMTSSSNFAHATNTSKIFIGNETTTTNKVLTLRGMASQSGNLFELQNSSVTLLSAFDSAGRLGVGVAPSSTVQIKTTLGATGNRGLEINGITSQTGDYLAILSSVGTKAFWFASTGAMGFGSGALAGMANANLAPYLDVSFGGSPASIVMGANLNNVTRTNNTDKYGRFYGAPYATAQNAVNIMHYASTGSVNELYVGGGSSIGQAFTGLFFYTTPSINTNSGTQRMAMFGSGRIALGDGLVELYTARLAVVNTTTATDSTLELRRKSDQTGAQLSFRTSAGTVQSAFDKDGYLSVGESVLNAASPVAHAQSVYYAPTTISDNSATFKSLTAISNSSAMNTYSWSGIWSRMQKSGAGTNEAIYGIGGQIETLSGSGTLAQSKALYYVMQYDSNVTDSRGIDIYSSINTGSTVNAHYGLYLRNMAGSGTLTTQYGIYLEDMAKGGTNFAIRSLGGEVAFAGQTNVGLTGGAGKLSVLSTTEQLRLYYDVSNYFSTTVSSAGAVTFNAVGAGANFLFSDDVELDGALNHDGTTVGLYGVTPVARSSTYTVTNGTTDRTYDADATTVNELADVVATLIADLKATGIIG